MKRFFSWLLAVASLLGVVGTSRADLPALTALMLPQLFGQETSPTQLGGTDPPGLVGEQLRVMPRVVAAQAPADDACCDQFWDYVASLLEFAPEARLVLGQIRPATPYHIAAAAVLEYFSAMDAAQRSAPVLNEVNYDLPACSKDGPCRACEVLPCPKPAEMKRIFVLGIGPDGPYAVRCVSEVHSCTKTGYGCGTYPPCVASGVADACDNGVCCQASAVYAAPSKGCKCCEKCGDGKECACKKSGGVTVTMERVGGNQLWLTRPHSGLPVAMAQLRLPLHPPVPIGFPMPPPPPQAWMTPLPHSPLSELAELNRQRLMICAAIEQIEQELAHIECQQRVVMQFPPLAVAHNAHKVHLVTDHFEAHCESVSCVGGDPHRLLLQGDVCLTCRKSGQAVRIEAPCVVINMKDGTFTVNSRTSVAVPAPALQSVFHLQPMICPTRAVSCPVPAYMPIMPGQPFPAPSQAAPASPREVGDK